MRDNLGLTQLCDVIAATFVQHAPSLLDVRIKELPHFRAFGKLGSCKSAKLWNTAAQGRSQTYPQRSRASWPLTWTGHVLTLKQCAAARRPIRLCRTSAYACGWFLGIRWLTRVREDAGTITDLKKYLHQLGLPTRFRQRIMYESRLLEEDRALDAQWLCWGDGGPVECLR